jgi:hypothetical protein
MTEQGPDPLASLLKHESRPLAFIAIWFVAVALASGLWWNVPLIDDWTYAWPIERLLSTGRLEVLDWTGNFAVGQVLWGAAWSALFGFSFSTLRLSTLVLGLVACAATYLMLRDLRVPRAVALVGALTLAVNPVFVVLSASFMTDVPFTACTTLALLCYARAAQLDRPRYLWWAGFWALAACSIRQVGIVVPIAGAPLFFARGLRNVRAVTVGAALAVTWVAMAALWLGLEALVGRTSMMTRWVDRLQGVLVVSPFSYFTYNLDLWIVLALFLLPALLSAASTRSLWRSPTLAAAAVLAITTLVAVFGGLPLPLAPSETWNLREIGASRALVSGSMPRESIWMDWSARIAGLLAFTLLVAMPLHWLLPRLAATRRALKVRIGVPAAWSSNRAAAMMCHAAFVAGYLGITNLFWLYNDRYYLPLIPPLVALVLAVHPVPRTAPRPVWVPIALLAAASLIGSRDAFRFNLAVRHAWDALVSAGVPPSDIDAGYAWNGWLLYAHPENLAERQNARRDVPWITSARQTKYVLAKSPIEGYTVDRTIAWTDLPWPGPDRVLVLRQQPEDGRR